MVALGVIKYLKDTASTPLVLGGMTEPESLTYSDVSEATGPKYRSVLAYGTRFSVDSGMVSMKVKASDRVVLSSMEGELTGYFESFKTSAKISNLVSEFSWKINPIRTIFGDNEKGVEFLTGDAKGDGLRHADKRLSYLREEIATGNVNLVWTPGSTLVVDGLTKGVTVDQFENMRHDILGHRLLEN
jgi:hypothetical protein